MGTIFLVIGFALLASSQISHGHNHPRHINSVAHFKSSSSPGCLVKPPKSIFLLGPANACNAKKPLKLTSVLKMGKQLCSPDWRICEKDDKPVHQLSWKSHKMPDGCYAFNYGKKKAAGYGQHCRANLYFDGVLCCPIPKTKADHYLNTKSPKVIAANHHHRSNFKQRIDQGHQDIHLNLLKK